MKTSVLILRRRRSRAGPSVSLFPFLAVLICTMGALVPLLLAIARQARLQAVQEANAKIAQQQAGLQTQRDVAQQRLGELAGSHKKAEEELAKARSELDNVDNHTKRLDGEAARLRSQLDGLNVSRAERGQQRAEQVTQLEKLRAEFDQATRQMGAAEQDAKSRRKSFSVVPYEGPNGTYRRPIYIECRGEAIILQPEGIVLTEADFKEPLENGNPLDRALRSYRELLLAKKEHGAGSEEPYPLFLVRPEGIPAYYVARAAMKSWKSEIGYELIGDDWDMKFPQPDADMERALRVAVAGAREELRQRTALAAGLLPSSGRQSADWSPGHVAASLRDANVGLGETDPRGFGGGTGGGTGGGVGGGPSAGLLAGPGSSSSAFVGQGGGSAGSVGSGGYGASGLLGTGQSHVDASLRDANAGLGVTDPRGRATGTMAASAASPSGGKVPATFADDTNRSGANSGAAAGSRSPSTEKMPEGVLRGGPSGGQVARSDAPSSNHEGTQSLRMRPGEWIPEGPKPPRQPEEKDEEDSKDHRKTKRLADSRGKNWGLPNAARGSVGVVRPIRVRCFPDRLELSSSAGQAAPQVVPLGPRTEDAVDEVISAVWDQIKPWGIAGRGMYWRPLLKIDVVPEAGGRFTELKTLLDNSGLLVERTSG